LRVRKGFLDSPKVLLVWGVQRQYSISIHTGQRSEVNAQVSEIMIVTSSIIPNDIHRIIKVLAPLASYVVGGVVRDIALSILRYGEIPPGTLKGKDWDIATACRPEEAMRRDRKSVV